MKNSRQKISVLALFLVVVISSLATSMLEDDCSDLRLAKDALHSLLDDYYGKKDMEANYAFIALLITSLNEYNPECVNEADQQVQAQYEFIESEYCEYTPTCTPETILRIMGSSGGCASCTELAVKASFLEKNDINMGELEGLVELNRLQSLESLPTNYNFKTESLVIQKALMMEKLRLSPKGIQLNETFTPQELNRLQPYLQPAASLQQMKEKN